MISNTDKPIRVASVVAYVIFLHVPPRICLSTMLVQMLDGTTTLSYINEIIAGRPWAKLNLVVCEVK
jgi:hypothetical protein